MMASVQDGAFSWLLCAASFFNISVIGGFFYTSGMFYIFFKEFLGATDSEASLMTSINIGVETAVCPFIGLTIERFGHRRVAMLGSVVATTGLALSAFSTRVYHMYICFGFITGLGFGMLNITSITIIGAYFNKYRRISLTLVLTGFGAGSFIMPPILNFLEQVYGWRGAILLLAGINAHTLLTCALFRSCDTAQSEMGNHEQTVTLKADGRPSESHIKQWLNENVKAIKRKVSEILSLFKITSYSCLMLCTVIVTFPLYIVLTHLGSYMLTLQFTNDDVVNLYMTLGISATVARPVAGLIAQFTHANPALYMTLTVLLLGVLTMCVPHVSQLWIMFAYAVMFHQLLGPYLGLGAAMIMEQVPKAHVATAYGLNICFSVPGNALGGIIGVWLYHYTGVYAHTFYLAGGLIILSGLVMVPAAYNIHKETPCIKTEQSISQLGFAKPNTQLGILEGVSEMKEVTFVGAAHKEVTAFGTSS